MNLVIDNHTFQYETEKLLRVFFPSTKIAVTDRRNDEADCVVTSLRPLPGGASLRVSYALLGKTAEKAQDVSAAECVFGEREADLYERRMVQLLYDLLRALTGYTPPWGILTGVRPAKLMLTLSNRFGEAAATGYFRTELRVSAEKTALALSVAKTEMPITLESGPRSFSLYVSIPFCPSRCSYCSFVSHSITNANAKKLLAPYLENLKRELAATGAIARLLGLRLESIYFGGGTPGILSAAQSEELMAVIHEHFDCSPCREVTFEAGRADVITREKLLALKESGVDRVSINPQTYDDAVLCAIGRRHTAQQAVDAFHLAKEVGFQTVNTDLIAGLPGDTVSGFCASLDQALALGSENITVHALALKRSSRMVAQENADLNTDDTARQMVDHANKTLRESGYIPYYMYRQSRCVGNLENVGWCLPGHECLYNVYMMEELHTVLAVGAGAVTRLKTPGRNYIERIFNFKYPYEYNSRFDELLRRKQRIGGFYEECQKRGE